MITVRDIMSPNVITVTPDMEIAEATRILLEKRVNGVPVVDTEGKLVGILCQSDLVAQQKQFPLPSIFTLLDGYMPLSSMKRFEKEVEKIAAATVAQAMTPDPVTVEPGVSIEEVAILMVDKNFHTLPVLEGDRLIGIVGKEDVLRTLLPSP
jgi:CBS domain-containing protein